MTLTSLVKGIDVHTCALRHIRPLMTLDAAKMVGHSIVSSRLDYANALLHGTSTNNINRLQVAQNSLARVVCSASATSAAPLVACLSTDQPQAVSHHIQNVINWQPGLPTSSHPRLSTCTHAAIIGQIVTYCTSDGTSIVSESVQR